MPKKMPHSGQPQGKSGRGGDSFRKIKLSCITSTVKRATSREGWLHRGRP